MNLLNWSALLVDDDPLFRELISAFLSKLQCTTIIEADSGKAALPSVMTKRFDLLVLDVEMHPIGGLQLSRLIRTQDNPNRESPVFILTGHTSIDTVLAAQKAGATGVLAKPLSFAAFAEKIRAVLPCQPLDVEAQS